jgi:Glyoxalase superfamily protein
MSGPGFDLTAAKACARRLRAELAARGIAISHSQALERVARAAGFADWNALFAAIGNRPPEAWAVGQRVRGLYLRQRFQGRIIRAEMTRPG